MAIRTLGYTAKLQESEKARKRDTRGKFNTYHLLKAAAHYFLILVGEGLTE